MKSYFITRISDLVAEMDRIGAQLEEAQANAAALLSPIKPGDRIDAMRNTDARTPCTIEVEQIWANVYEGVLVIHASGHRVAKNGTLAADYGHAKVSL